MAAAILPVRAPSRCSRTPNGSSRSSTQLGDRRALRRGAWSGRRRGPVARRARADARVASRPASRASASTAGRRATWGSRAPRCPSRGASLRRGSSSMVRAEMERGYADAVRAATDHRPLRPTIRTEADATRWCSTHRGPRRARDAGLGARLGELADPGGRDLGSERPFLPVALGRRLADAIPAPRSTWCRARGTSSRRKRHVRWPTRSRRCSHVDGLRRAAVRRTACDPR